MGDLSYNIRGFPGKNSNDLSYFSGQVPGIFQVENLNIFPMYCGTSFQALRDLTANVRDMKSYVNEIFTRTYNMEQKFGSGTGAQPTVGSSPDPALRSLIETMQNDVRQIRTTQLGTVSFFSCRLSVWG